jgi:PhoPQ-activated pathogenicity-related protein
MRPPLCSVQPVSRKFGFAVTIVALSFVGYVPAEDHLRAVAQPTALDDYVAAPDDSYTWELVDTRQIGDSTMYVVEMTSQTWRPENTDRPQWKHHITILKPKGADHNTALLFIGGGKNGGPPPTTPDIVTLTLAKETRSVVAELKMIPNQPLVFNDDGEPRNEDNLIAYTWNQVITTSDPTWSARLPMVKSAVRAMDTVQKVLASDEGGKLGIDKFVVVGGSKRGWTTWLTGAVDRRVVAIIPAVIDVLNVKRSMTHHFEAYGFWAPAVGDYVRHKIMEKQDLPGYELLLQFEDPIRYAERLTIPKYIVNAAGDQFFLPDSSQFYWDELEGEKHLRYVANTDHSLANSDAPQTIAAFYHAIMKNQPRPEYDWHFEDDGSIHVRCKDKPKEVVLWQATNPEARDFRLEKIGRAYKSTPLEPTGEGTYVGNVEEPADGFTAYFVEMTFESGFKFPFKFTSGVRVSPDKLPFKGALQPALQEAAP